MDHHIHTRSTYTPGMRALSTPAGDSFPGPGASPSMWPDFLAGQPGKPVKVLLMDEDPHMRLVVAQELLADQRINLVAQASSARDGRRLIDQCEFDVLMMNLDAGDQHGFDLIKRVKSARSQAEVVVLSSVEDESHALQAFHMGATGYLVKNSWFGNFPQAVLEVVNGGAPITPSMARRLLQRLGPVRQTPMAIKVSSGGDHEALSEREKEILRMVAGGFTSMDIGGKLCISCLTVNTHIKNIYRKLHVHTRAQAVSCATHLGLL